MNAEAEGRCTFAKNNMATVALVVYTTLNSIVYTMLHWAYGVVLSVHLPRKNLPRICQQKNPPTDQKGYR